MDLLSSGDDPPPRPARLPRFPGLRPAVARASTVVAAGLVVVLVASTATLVRFDADAPPPTALPLRASDVPASIVAVSDRGTRLILGGTSGYLLDRPLRGARQLSGDVVVGLANGTVAVTRTGARALPDADYVVPARGGRDVWLVRNGLAGRHDDTGGQLGFRPLGDARLVGETAEGLVVVDDGAVKVLDGRGAARRTILNDGRAMAVGGDRVVLQPAACLWCPLQIDDGETARPLRSTADPDQLRNPDSVRISPDGRFLAYTRLLSGQIGHPLSGVGEVVVVDVGSGRLRVVPRSQGTEWESQLAWVGRTLMFVRRLGSRLVIAVVEPAALRTGEIAIDPDIDDVVGAVAVR